VVTRGCEATFRVVSSTEVRRSSRRSTTWPIAPGLGGTLQVAVGNVFDAHLSDFKPELSRLSCAFALATTTDPPFEFLVGFGTETFEHGTQVDSLRVSLGIPRSF
jgi:hypothetical protein